MKLDLQDTGIAQHVIRIQSAATLYRHDESRERIAAHLTFFHQIVQLLIDAASLLDMLNDLMLPRLCLIRMSQLSMDHGQEIGVLLRGRILEAESLTYEQAYATAVQELAQEQLGKKRRDEYRDGSLRIKVPSQNP